MEKRTKIICTIGPACWSEETIRGMVDRGMNVARFNYSHMKHEDALRTITIIKDLREERSIPIALMLDTKGPEVRLYGHDGPVELSAGDEITVESYTGTDLESVRLEDDNRFFTNLPSLGSLAQSGTRVLIMDGLLEGKVVRKENDTLYIRLINSAVLRPKAHFAIPNTEYPLDFLGEKDKEDILFAVEYEFEYIALSFVGSAADIFKVRNLIIDNYPQSRTKLIAKIENKKATEHIDEIISHSDGIMVARGDLGVEMDMAEVPIMQKKIIEKSFLRGKPVITATQMLESMIDKPIPTRAEASDVANACFDLTSAVMLSGETAIGRFPELVVQTMADIVKTVEVNLDYDKILLRTYDRRRSVQKDLTTIVSGNAVSIADESRARAIVAVTKTGYSARMLSKLRPKQPIWAFTYDIHTYHQMSINWGIHPFMIQEETSFESLVALIKEVCMKEGVADQGERIVIVGGLPLGRQGTTNMVRVETVGKRPIRGKCLNDRSVSAPAVFITDREDFKSKDISGKVLFLHDFKKEYVGHFKLAAGIVMESDLYENDLSLLGVAFDIPIIINVSGAFEQFLEGSVVEINGENNELIEI